MLLIITIATMLVYRLQDSRLGRAWVALREDELAAASMGINTVSTKLLAFAIGASTAGLAGVFYSAKLASITPQQFEFQVSFTALAMVVLGGMGNISGAIVGALVLYYLVFVLIPGLPDYATSLAATLGLSSDLGSAIADATTRLNYIIYGLLLVAVMLLRPQGILPSRVREQELKHAAVQEDEAAVEMTH